MRAGALIVTVMLLCCAAITTAQQEPVLVAHAPLLYPPIARAARVSGTVSVEFQMNENGETSAVSAVNGPTMLRAAAENFVKSWKFDPQTVGSNANTRFTATVAFKAVEAVVDPRTGNDVTIRSDSFRHFEIAITVSDIQMSECPTGAEEDVPTGREEDDFVELSRSGCYGTCPAYTVKVQAGGAIYWEGDSYVTVRGRRASTVDADKARHLLERFRTSAFWSWCGGYTRRITDESGTQITVRLGGRTRRIWDYAESSPQELQDLMLEVDRAADSHRWRHGDPRLESITHVGPDTYLPKPGVTPLMLAAGRNQPDRLKALLASGVDVNATDSSGWTALMYASRVSSSTPVQELLKAGADPNQASPHGDTALMVDALSGDWNDDLVKAGARVNAQNNEGQSALMMLATGADPDEIVHALAAGANPILKDHLGRPAIEYLHLANCGKSPVRDPIKAGMTGYSRCNVLDSDDVKKAKALLSAAMRVHR